MSKYEQKNWQPGDIITPAQLNKIEQQVAALAPIANHLIQIYDINKLRSYKYGDYVIKQDQNGDKLYRATRDYPNDITLGDDSWEQINNIGQALGIIDQHSKAAMETVAIQFNAVQNISTLYYLNDKLEREIQLTNEHLDLTDQLINSNIPALYCLHDQLQRQTQSINKNLQETKTNVSTMNNNIQRLNSQTSMTANSLQQISQHIPTLYYLTEKLFNDINLINQNIVASDEVVDKTINNIINDITFNKTHISALHTLIDSNYRELTNSIQQIHAQVKTKQDITPMVQIGNLYSEIDRVERNAHTEAINVQDMSATKAAAEFLILQLDALDRTVSSKISTQDFITRLSTITGYLLTNIEQLDVNITTNRTNIANNITRISNLSTALNSRIAKPTNSSVNGIAGQVLSTNGDGTTQWIDAFTPADGQIADAVAEWLDNNPTATTTVADGSITLKKLSQEVINIINNSADAKEALCLIEGLMADYQLRINDNLQHRQFINMQDEFKSKLLTYAGHFNSGRYNNMHNYLDADGIGFLFFTDPHLIDGRVYGHTTESLLHGLQIIRNLFDMTPAKYVVCGGDWLNESYKPNNNDETGVNIKSQAILALGGIPNLLHDRISEHTYNIAGNHEYIYQLHGSNELTEKNLAKLWYDKDINYFTVDTYTTRCYMFDSGTMISEMNDYRWTQLQWFGDLLQNSNILHHFGVIHIAYLLDSNGAIKSTPEPLITNLCQIANAFNNKTIITLNNITYDFRNTIGKFHFMLAGHLHGDFNFTINNIPVILTRAFFKNYSIDGVYANFDTATIYLTRFGDGNDRAFSIIPND